jgi:galactose oxidase
MLNLGNAWHIPGNPEPRGRGGMRDPVGPLVPGSSVTIFSGNQFQGDGNPGNQLQDGSSLFFKRQPDVGWRPLPLSFQSTDGDNKYYAATIPADTFQPGDLVQYYLRIAYDDHAPTFLKANGVGSTTTADETAAQAQPFTYTIESSSVRGQWGEVFTLRNAAIHAHVLSNGLVLMWGRRDRPDQSLDVHECTPFLWDPATNQVTDTPQPMLADGTKINLFCSGHTFLPDGRLLVVGGHLFDSQGLDQATTYDAMSDTWTPTALMNDGRWYPTATSLPDGSVLVLSGSFEQNGQTANNAIPQVWNNGAWRESAGLPTSSFDLYPRVHVGSSGSIVMTGAQSTTWSLDVANGGQWTQITRRANGSRDYCPSVMYDVDKIIYVGGGNESGTHQPTANTEIVDLGAIPPEWSAAAPMRFPRRQHNGTILPDGTVLVTGGTRGGGGPGPNPMGFNDLAPGQPVHVAELWDPSADKWTELAAEQVDRCYHSTALLLPDATVLSAGGGEYRPIEGQDLENDPQDTHRDGQVFSPPYLFKGPRPEITSAPDSVGYGATFDVATPQPQDIAKVSLIRLSSVTHAFNVDQRINFLQFQVNAGSLLVAAPSSPNVCPPGHYMLFILNRAGVPSVARIIEISAAAGVTAKAAEDLAVTATSAGPGDSGRQEFADAFARRDAAVLAAAGGPAVVVGINGTCPYGIGACWGGAHEALLGLEGVASVDPIPDADNSTARVFLEDEKLPALDRWRAEFRRMVNGSYVLRGVEVSLESSIESSNGELFLTGGDSRPSVQLAPLVPADKIQWDRTAGAPQQLAADEQGAYDRLAAKAPELALGQRVTVTGPLKKTDAGYHLEVRLFTL